MQILIPRVGVGPKIRARINKRCEGEDHSSVRSDPVFISNIIFIMDFCIKFYF